MGEIKVEMKALSSYNEGSFSCTYKLGRICYCVACRLAESSRGLAWAEPNSSNHVRTSGWTLGNDEGGIITC